MTQAKGNQSAQLFIMNFTAFFKSRRFSTFVALILSTPNSFTRKSTSLSLTLSYLNVKEQSYCLAWDRDLSSLAVFDDDSYRYFSSTAMFMPREDCYLDCFCGYCTDYSILSDMCSINV